MNEGDKVWFRGQFAKEFSIRGEIECIEDPKLSPGGYGLMASPQPRAKYGVRLENGNFKWAERDQLKPRKSDYV